MLISIRNLNGKIENGIVVYAGIAPLAIYWNSVSCYMPAIILKLISLVGLGFFFILLVCRFVRIYDMKWRQSFVYL